MKRSVFHLLVLLLITNLACKSNNTGSGNEVTLNGVIVLNEGNFGRANASVTVYNPVDKSVLQNRYENANGDPIGDVLHSVTEIEDRLYLVVNNSNKIEVVDKSSFQNIATIQIANQASPRQLVQVSDTKAYVTNLFGASVSVIDLESNTEGATIAVGANPEGIVVTGERAYVANSGFGNGNTISIINTTTNEVVNTLTVGDNPVSLVKQSNGRVWVVCVGAYGDLSNPDDDTPGRIFVLNGETGSVITNFEVGGHPGDLVLSETDGVAYLINGSSVMSINMNSFEILNSEFINRSFYALGLSTSDEGQFIWGADAKNFAQAGLAIQYDANGVKVDSFATGIIPGSFHFDSE